jgi:hypothetical protein
MVNWIKPELNLIYKWAALTLVGLLEIRILNVFSLEHTEQWPYFSI